mmetsp:Transcript_35654/g.114000  ORF Transcript_35654/g.114000 Transcript_35654/m.114000 type:complete len:310 (-) Transcript_35654:99-1028(-)
MLRRLLARASVLSLSAGLTTTTTTVPAKGEEAKKVRVAVIQMRVEEEKSKNLARCAELLKAAAAKGAELLVLPEVWNSAYAVSAFRGNAEPVSEERFGPSLKLLRTFAAEHGVWIVGGSIPEVDGEKIYNTSPIVDPSGTLVAKHRKVHLFDIDVKNKLRFFESETLTAGDRATVVPFFKDDGLGVAVCYDMRFSELAIAMRKKGATILVYPGAFNTVTGPPHYRLLAKARALDSQAFVIAASPARNPAAAYQAYGYSIVLDPWATVVARADGHDEEIIIADLDLSRVDDVRASMRLLDQRRPDVYGDE